MTRNLLAAAALLSGLAAAPAFAQTAPDPARTLDQNQRAYVAPLPIPVAGSAQAAPAKDRPVAATQPAAPTRRVVLADKAR